MKDIAMTKRLRFYSILLIFPLITGALFLLAFSNQEQPQSEEQYIYETKIGKVTFSHLKHQERIEKDCQICHHEVSQEKPAEACSNCHKKIVQITPLGEAMPLSKAFHTKCIACHQKKLNEEKKPPVKCQECHIKQEQEIKPVINR